MNNQSFSYLFKFVIVGESGVGKSCIVLNFTEQKPRKQHQITIACEFASRVVQIKGMNIKVQIWDTAGQENFRSITRSYYRASVAAIICYDITSRISFDKVKGWLQELQDNAHDDISIILVGNKLDLENEREISYDEGFTYAKANGMKFTETCAFDLQTIEPMFIGLAKDILKNIETGKIDPNNELTGIKVGSNMALKNQKKKGSKLKKGHGNGEKKKCCGS